MGLRCLMGHDFGDVSTERDRHERGDEVVVTVREYRECDRCGETRVVSENKEVRRVAGTASPDEGADSPEAPAGRAPGEDGDFGDVSADEDDGVILEDEPEEREPGAWPETDGAEPEEDDDEPAPWPEVEGEDEGYDAEPSDGAPVEGVQFDSGLTPEASADDADGATPEAGGDVIESTAGGDRGGFRRSSQVAPRSGQQRTVAAETELLCPECEHTAPTENSSLRPGDICPECRLGYLTERER